MNFDELADQESIDKTVGSLTQKGYEVIVVENKQQALDNIKKLIPDRATVMNGASVTLKQIGYLDYLQNQKHKWIDLHAQIALENDDKKRAQLRRESVLSDYYLGSVHALIENGEFILASNTGSQLPHVVFTSPNLIFVVSSKKIVVNFDQALKRLEDYVVPMENERLMEEHGTHTQLNKLMIFKGEAPYLGRKIHFILVKEDLGF